MRQIGFKNFRRFKDFPIIDLAPITMFVGENNAGKSTVVKAILAILDYLNSSVADNGFNDVNTSILNQQFYFNKSYFTHIGTFQRALNNNADEGKIIFEITFKMYKFTIEVAGDREDEEAISGRISRILITLLQYNIDFDYDFRSDNVHVTFHHDPNPIWEGDSSNYRKALQDKDKRINNQYYGSFKEDVELDMSISGINAPFIGNNIRTLLSIALAKINATIMATKKGREQSLLPFAEQS